MQGVAIMVNAGLINSPGVDRRLKCSSHASLSWCRVRCLHCITRLEGLGMMDSFSIADTTWVFFGLVGFLLIASTALFWSIEDQRAQRRITRTRR